jgi:hypothetical protein
VHAAAGGQAQWMALEWPCPRPPHVNNATTTFRVEKRHATKLATRIAPYPAPRLALMVRHAQRSRMSKGQPRQKEKGEEIKKCRKKALRFVH